MSDNEFLKLVRYLDWDKTKEYLDSHNINEVLSLLSRNNALYKDRFDYIYNYYPNQKITKEIAMICINKRIIDINNLPSYMYEDTSYIDYIAQNASLFAEGKVEFVNSLIEHNCLTESAIKKFFSYGVNEKGYNDKLFSNPNYTKVLASLDGRIGFAFKKEGITDEVIDEVLKHDGSYSTRAEYQNCDLYKNFYYIYNSLKKQQDTLNYINNHLDSYSDNELMKLVEVCTEKRYDKRIYGILNRDVKYINYYLDNVSSYGNSTVLENLSNKYLKDPSNGIVKKLIDKGMYFDANTNKIILESEDYVNYYLDRTIATKSHFQWFNYVGQNIIDNPSNGIVFKAIENKCEILNRFLDNPIYVNKYIETSKSVRDLYSKISNSIKFDPTNNVINNMMDKDYYVFTSHSELFNIKEYLIHYINTINSKNVHTLKDVVDNCDINIIINNNLVEDVIELGYKITNATPKEILENENFIYYYCDCCIKRRNTNISALNDIFKLLSDEIINDPSNGIILNAIRNGYFYSNDTDKRIINNKEYILELIQSEEIYWSIQLINNLNEEFLNDRNIVIPCIEKGYRYEEKKTPKILYQVDYLKKYFAYYNDSNPLWITFNHIIPYIPEEIVNDSSNGLVYSAFDYGYEINLYTPNIIKDNLDYVLYYAKLHIKGMTALFYNLKPDDEKYYNNEKFVYSILDYGYLLSNQTPKTIINNYNYIMYALKYGRIDDYTFKVPKNLIDEKMARLLIANKCYRSVGEEFYKQFNLDYEYVIKRGDFYLLNGEPMAQFLRANRDNELTIDMIDKEWLKDKNKVRALINYLPNVIDYIDDNMVDEELISYAFINDYEFNNIDKLTSYINKVGLKEIIKYNSKVIEYYTEEEFNNLFNQDYEEIIRYAVEKGYSIKNAIVDLPVNLNNKKFIMIAIDNNVVDIVNYVDFKLDRELFEKIWTKNITIPLLKDNIKEQIINNEELFDIILKSTKQKKLCSISLFYPKNVSHKNLNILLDQVLIGYKISNRDLFVYNLSYLFAKNKELFYNLNLEILTDKFLFLGIETINRIIPDKGLLFKVTRLNENKLKIFNICINYLYSLNLDINVNDILYKVVSSLDSGNFNNMCKSINENFKRMDVLINTLKEGTTKGRNIAFLDNLINILYMENNHYNIESFIDINHFIDKKNEYFKSHIIFDLNGIKDLILEKYYNMNYSTGEFIYKRYCYKKEDIEKINDVKIRKILYDLIFLMECDDIDILKNVYLNLSVENIDFKYSVLLEQLIRNIYIEQYNDKLSSNKIINIEDNIYEVEDNVNLLVHVLGAYNSKYKEPANFKDEWNIELMKNHGVCTSYITNQNLSTARNIKYPTLVFNELENNSMLLSSPDDIASNSMNESFATSLMKPCCFLLPDTMIDETRYHHNEIVLERKYLDDKSNINYKRLPNYVLFIATKDYINEDESLNMDKIKSTDLWRMTEKASKDFNVPILIINKVKINKKEIEEINKLKEEMISTNNYLLINKIIVRYMNNLMDLDNIITTDDIDNFINSMLKLSGEIENGKEILEILMYTITEENRKFNEHKAEKKYNYINKFETIVYDKIREYNKEVEDDKKVKI